MLDTFPQDIIFGNFVLIDEESIEDPHIQSFILKVNLRNGRTRFFVVLYYVIAHDSRLSASLFSKLISSLGCGRRYIRRNISNNIGMMRCEQRDIRRIGMMRCEQRDIRRNISNIIGLMGCRQHDRYDINTNLLDCRRQKRINGRHKRNEIVYISGRHKQISGRHKQNIYLLIHICLLGCGRRNSNDLRNNVITLNSSTISYEEINQLLFIFKEVNDVFDWTYENMWYNDEKEIIIRDIITVMKRINCICYDDHFGMMDKECYVCECDGETYTVNITLLDDVIFPPDGNLTTEIHDVGSIPYDDNVNSISGIIISIINILVNGTRTKESTSWNEIDGIFSNQTILCDYDPYSWCYQP